MEHSSGEITQSLVMSIIEILIVAHPPVKLNAANINEQVFSFDPDIVQISERDKSKSVNAT